MNLKPIDLQTSVSFVGRESEVHFKPPSCGFSPHDAEVASKDYTCFSAPSGTEFDGGQNPLEHFSVNGLSNESRFTYSGKVAVKSYQGRGLLCKCFDGNAISLTVRSDRRPDQDSTDFKQSQALSMEFFNEVTQSLSQDRPPLEASPFWLDDGKENLSADTIRRIAIETFGRSTIPSQGLLVVAGATNSYKSTIVRGLICEYLTRLWRAAPPSIMKRPRYHLLSYEDPIERYLCDEPRAARKLGLDYTPRQLHSDVANLRQAVNDSLRQTPALFYVGEIREDEDWKELLRFAGTGHFAVTTTHANSLVETMGKIFKSVEAKTPAARGMYSERIVGVIHLRQVSATVLTPDDKPKVVGAVIPSLWRRTPSSVAAIVTDGLASLAPAFFDLASPMNNSPDSIGRSAFLNILFSEWRKRPETGIHSAIMAFSHLPLERLNEYASSIERALQVQTTLLDLQGS